MVFMSINRITKHIENTTMKKKNSEAVSARIPGILGVLILLLYFSINTLSATTYYSRATGNWNTNTTWSLTSGGSAVSAGIYPIAGDIVYIQNNRTVTVNATAACADVNIATGSALTINGFNFTSSGTTTVSGTLTHTSTTATKTFNNVVISGGTWTNNASESYTIANLTLSGSTINGTGTGVFNVTGALNVASGTNTMNAMTITVGGTTTVQGTLVFASTTGNKTFGNVVLSGGTWTSNAAETYPCTNLTLSGGTITGSTTGTFTVSGNLAVTAGSVNNLYAFNLTVNGVTTVDGSAVFLSATGTKTFVGLTTVSSTGTWDNDNVVEPINFRGGLTNNGVFFAGTSVYTFSTNTQTINGTLSIPNITVTGVTVTNNGNLTIPTALSGTGALTNSATGTLNIGGTSGITTLTATAVGNIVNYNGAAQTVKATTYNNLTLSGSGTKTNTGTTVTGVLSIEGTAAPSTAPTWSGTAYTLQYKTTDAHTAGTEWISPFAGSGGVIIANTAGSVTMNSVEVMGTSVPLTINSGATLATGNFQLTLGGNFINNGGTFTAGSSPIVITGTATQSIAGFSSTGAVSSTKTGGIATFVGNVNAGSLTMNGLGGTMNLGSGLTHTISGIWTRTNGTLDGGSSVIKFGSSVSGNGGAFTANTSTVEWNATGAQTIPALAYYNLTLSGSGAKTLSTGTTIQNNFATAGTTTTTAVEAMTVGGNFTIGTGTSFSASTFTHNIAGNWSNTGTFNANTSTINLNGTTQSITGATSFNNLTLSGSATKFFTNAITTTGSFTINSGVIANLGTGLTHSANTLSIAGSGQPAGSWGGVGSAATFINSTYFAPASGTLNITSATCVAGSWTGLVSTDWNTATNWCDGVVPTSSTNVIINSGGNQPVINAASFCNNITVNAGASLTIAGTNSLTINGSWTNSGTFTANSGTVIYNGTSQTVVPVNYYHLTLSGSGTKTLQSATTTIGGDLTLSGTVSSTAVVGLTINGNMTIGTGTTFIAGAFTHNVKGNWSNGGIFTATGSTINLNGDVATTISASNFNNISISGLGTKTATGTLSIAGNFNLSSGGLAFNNATSNAISIAGNYTQSGGVFDFNSNATGSSSMTLNGNFSQTSAVGSMTTTGAGAPNGIITFNGSGTQTISTSTPGSCIWVKYIIPVGKTVQLLSNFTISSADLATQPTYQGEINVSGTFDFGTYVVSQVDGVPGTAMFTLNSGANLITSNATGLTGSIFATNMTTNLSSAANYEFKGASTGTFTTTPTANTVNNLTFSGIGTTSLGSDFTTNGALTVNSAVNLSMSTYLLTLNGNFINNGTASGTTGGVTIGGIGTQSIAGFTTTGGVTCSKSAGVATLTGNINAASLTNSTAGGTLNLGSGLTHTISGAWTRIAGTLDGGSSTLNIGGTVTNTAGTFTPSTGTVNYTGAAQTIADVNYYNLTFSGSAAKTMGANSTTIGGNLTLSGTASVTPAVALTISGNLTIGSGTTFTAGSFTHNIGGNFTNSGTFTPTTSTINLNGTTQSLSGATTFNNLTLAGSGTKTFANNTTTNGNFSIASGAVANLGTGLTHTASNLYLGGTQQSSSTWGGTGSVADNINTTYFAASTGIISNLKNWTGNTSTDWNLATNWSDGRIPTSTDNVIIPNVTNKPIIGASASCKNITINTGSSLTITGTNTLTVSGNWTNNGTFTANSSTVLFTGGTQTIVGTNTFNNLTAGGTGLKTFSTNPTVNGILSMEGTGTVSAAPTYGTAATLRYNTTTARTAGSEWITPFVATGGVIIGSTGVISLNSAEVINAPLTINSGSTLNTTSANNYALTFGGNFTNNGTLTANASPITITGTATQSIAGFTTTGTVSSTKTGGIATLSGNVSAGSLTINGAGGTLNLGTSLSHTITGDILITTGILDAGSSIITTSGNWTNNTWSSFTPGSSTVYMTGTAKAIGGIAPTTFNNLTVSSGSTTLNGNGNIAGNLTINSNATLTNSSTYTLSVTGTTTISGTYTDGSTGAKSFTGDISISSGGVWNETMGGFKNSTSG